MKEELDKIVEDIKTYGVPILNELHKLKPSLWERIIGKSKFDPVIKLRDEIRELVEYWDNEDFENKMHLNVSGRLTQITMYSVNEEKLYRDKGLDGVLDRLSSDRDFLIDYFSESGIDNLVKISKHKKQKEREYKLKRILKIEKG